MQARISAKPEPWDVSIEVRPGLVVPTLSPMEAGDAPSVLSTGAQSAGVVREPWPGLFRWAWRGLFGRRDNDSPDVRVLRRVFVAVTPKDQHRHARRRGGLTGAELMLFAVVYMQAQIAWCGRIGKRAEAEIQGQASGAADAPRPGTRPWSVEGMEAAHGATRAGAGRAGAGRVPKPGDTLRIPSGQEVTVPTNTGVGGTA